VKKPEIAEDVCGSRFRSIEPSDNPFADAVARNRVVVVEEKKVVVTREEARNY